MKKILKIKVIKSSMVTAWYSHFIGQTFYAIEAENDSQKLIQCSEFGVVYRSYFDVDDVEIL